MVGLSEGGVGKSGIQGLKKDTAELALGQGRRGKGLGRLARREPWKHLSTGSKALASTAQRKRNGKKRRFLLRHQEDKPGNRTQ
jgi:hypothetical protein